LFCLQGGPCKEAIQVQAVKERKQNEKNLGWEEHRMEQIQVYSHAPQRKCTFRGLVRDWYF
jgi:hypothetical protein